MKKPQSIQIQIPNPCSEDWGKMRRGENGKFCDRCQHAVIDFTSFTDAQLYQFFSTHKNEKVCGRYRASQLNRIITIPPQPHSKLYRLVIAAGLTILAIVPMNDVRAKFRVPVVVEQTLIADKESTPGDNIITIKGTVSNSDGRPMRPVLNLYKNGAWIMNTFTHSDDGHFEFPPISYVEWSEIEFEVFAYRYEKVIVKIDLNNIQSFYDIQLQIDSAALKAKIPEGTFYTGEVGCRIIPPEKVNGRELHKRTGDAEDDCFEYNNPLLH